MVRYNAAPSASCGGVPSMQAGLGGSYESAVIGDRFRLDHPPTLLARTASVAPIGFTRLKSDGASLGRTTDVPTENAYLFHVQLQPAAVDMLIDGKRRPATTKTPAPRSFTISEAIRLPKSTHRSTMSGFTFPRLPSTNLPSIKASAEQRDCHLPCWVLVTGSCTDWRMRFSTMSSAPTSTAPCLSTTSRSPFTLTS
jgi:hypothetical protein